MLLLLFAAVMLAAGIGMLRPKQDKAPVQRGWGWVVLEGAVVGGITGFVGAGGGFLVVPALVLMAGVPMRAAVATSLAIVAAKSLIGFTGDLAAGTPIDAPFLLAFTALVAAGLVVGLQLAKRVEPARLQRGFGALVLLAGAVMILLEWRA
jgi:uncharacterized membrane protein YfcA